MCIYTHTTSAHALMGSQASHSSRTHTHRMIQFLTAITAFLSCGWTLTAFYSSTLHRTTMNILFDVWPTSLMYGCI